jgi:tetratricopeptide (TPR) repeat protein/predicted Ser/Thr protein kinase/TolB-like protein
MAELLDRLRTTLADRYTIERELGRGGMAVVYLAHDQRHDRRVAVKVLRPELAEFLGAERFLREVQITAQLNHPHILPLLDSGKADGLLYYVMPYVEGESLRKRIDREGQLPLDDALEIARGIAAALSYAHSHDVIHRDIKPENVLLSAGEAVVADFGIARAITEAAGESLTETGISIGTPAYMSPEQASGAHKIDGRSDLYALGCVLYEMLVGEPPFTGPSAQVIVAKHVAQPVPSTRVVRETVPPALDALIQRALAKAPADRFATARDFAEALARAGERWPWRGRMLVPLAAVAVAAGAAIAVFGLPGSHEIEPGEPSALTTGPPTVRVGVLPVLTRDGSADTSRQAQAIQRLFTSTLARYRGLDVVDPLSLNRRVAAETTQAGAEQLREAGRLGLQYVVHITTTRTPRALEVAYSLTHAAEAHIVETGSFSSTDDAMLPTQIRQASGRLAVALEAATGGLAKGLDVDPFLTRVSDSAAIRAFLQGVEYAYRFLPGGGEHFARALELDPDFIGPRVFLVSGLMARGDTAAASRHARVLQSLRPAATPFEQAAIGWAEAAVRGDVESMIRHARVSLAHAPRNNIVLFDLATNLWYVGRPWEAVEPARTAMESGWRFAPLYALWGRLAIEAGELNGLRDTLEFARTFDTPDPFLSGLLEALALFESDTTGAMKYGAAFRAEIGASNVAAGYAELTRPYRSLAQRARERGKPAAAVSLLQRLVDAGAGPPILGLELARALAERGDRRGAESNYVAVAGGELDDPEVLYLAGAVAELLDRPEDARRHFSRYLEVAANGPDALRVRERLRVLGRPGPP